MGYLCYLLWCTEGAGEKKRGKSGTIILVSILFCWIGKGAFVSWADGIYLLQLSDKKTTMWNVQSLMFTEDLALT